MISVSSSLNSITYSFWLIFDFHFYWIIRFVYIQPHEKHKSRVTISFFKFTEHFWWFYCLLLLIIHLYVSVCLRINNSSHKNIRCLCPLMTAQQIQVCQRVTTMQLPSGHQRMKSSKSVLSRLNLGTVLTGNTVKARHISIFFLPIQIWL